jgi:DNA-binding IclR family transcriptional regulator
MCTHRALLLLVRLLGKLDKPLLELLHSSPEALTLVEIAERLDKPQKAVYKTLKRLFEKGQIESKGRQYTVAA